MDSSEALRERLGFADPIYDRYWQNYDVGRAWIAKHVAVCASLQQEQAPGTSGATELGNHSAFFSSSVYYCTAEAFLDNFMGHF